MSKRAFLYWFWPLLLVWAVFVLYSTRVHAQELQQAYTLDHPIEPNWMILTTTEGRWQIERQSGDCGWLTSYLNVTVTSTETTTVLTPRDAGEPGCQVGVLGMVDRSPCYINAEGVCEVSFELPED